MRSAQDGQRAFLKLPLEEVRSLRCPQPDVTFPPLRKPSEAPRTHGSARANRLDSQVSHEPVLVPVHEDVRASVQQHSVENDAVHTGPIPAWERLPGVRPRVEIQLDHRACCPRDVVACDVIDGTGNAVADAEAPYLCLIPRLAEQREEEAICILAKAYFRAHHVVVVPRSANDAALRWVDFHEVGQRVLTGGIVVVVLVQFDNGPSSPGTLPREVADHSVVHYEAASGARRMKQVAHYLCRCAPN